MKMKYENTIFKKVICKDTNTINWFVIHKEGKRKLGVIEYHLLLHDYILYPIPNMLFSGKQISEINDFIKGLK